MDGNEEIPKNSVLMITLEYGRRIQGGLGRVVNGLFTHRSSQVALDIFLIKVTTNAAYLYRKDSNDIATCRYGGPYLTVLKKVLEEGIYGCVHFMHAAELVNNCLVEIKKIAPGMKLIYSCHSIVKHEIKIRNNKLSDLKHEEFSMNLADHIHVLNNTSLSYLANCYPELIDRISISVISNAIEESEFRVLDESFKARILSQIDYQKDILICTMSRWSYGKGLECLLDAIPKVVEKYDQAKFIIAGRKLQSWEHEVGEYVRIIDSKIETLKENVISFGWLDDKARNTLLSLATIYVMPSLLEYFPYSVLEPVVCKVPLISSRIDSVDEMLVEGIECSFYTPQDPDSLANCIIDRIENQKQGRKLAANAYRKVKEMYNWKLISAQYDLMYTAVMREPEYS